MTCSEVPAHELRRGKARKFKIAEYVERVEREVAKELAVRSARREEAVV